MLRKFSPLIVAAWSTLFAATYSQAATIDVLWLGSSNEDYETAIQGLADTAGSVGPNTWNMTFWADDTGGETVPVPDFGAYDVFVVGSTYQVSGTISRGRNTIRGNYTAADNYYGIGVDAQRVVDNSDAIEAERGERTFLSGQDADWHYLNNQVGRGYDGPEGFMINAVNWAASGAGLGIVSMTDRIARGEGWWTAEGSFLADELGDNVFVASDDSVFIGDGQDSFPINTDLTDAGLSTWGTSSHAGFNEIDGYTRINFENDNSQGFGITIVTSGQEDGGIGGPPDSGPPPIPLPAAAWMLILALGSLVGLRRLQA